MKGMPSLLAVAVLGALFVPAGPALANRCTDARTEGIGAFDAAATAQSEVRRIVRMRAGAAQRLELIDREIERRRIAAVASREAAQYCQTADGVDDADARKLRSLINRNERRLRAAQCQRLGFQAGALIDDAKDFERAVDERREAIRAHFQRGYERLKDGLSSSCPEGQKKTGIQLAKIEHHALTMLRTNGRTSGQVALSDKAFRTAIQHYRAQEYRQAARRFRAAAERGHARAQYYLGRLHMEGWGVPQSDETALYWFNESASQGDPAGQNSLGLMYDLGRGVAENDAKAVEWYARAAKQGLPFAQTNLGQMYEQGEGVRRDLDAAVKLYRTAADHGHVRAEFRLGRVYERGLGVKKDLVTAITHYRRAADRGYKPALQALAALGG